MLQLYMFWAFGVLTDVLDARVYFSDITCFVAHHVSLYPCATAMLGIPNTSGCTGGVRRV